jgi:tetratricopeptide (TPR) repeat protein
MSTLAKLSRQAVQLEHDRQYEKALALYERLFEDAASAKEEVDVALYNRAGDLAMRVGDQARAVGYYERAIDAYAGGGLLNNAIAVCNKVLRHAPDHAATHYTLAVLHGKQGFRGDAKFHYVEYADRMHRAGRDDEALRALVEFAALCPPGDDARAALAKHLSRGNRGAESTAKLDAMLAGVAPPAQDAALAPSTSAASSTSSISATDEDRGGSLVFLDVSLDGGMSEAPPAAAPAVAALDGLEPTSFGDPIDEGVPEVPVLLDPLDDAPLDLEVPTLDLDAPEFDAPVAVDLIDDGPELLVLDDAPVSELDAADWGAITLDVDDVSVPTLAEAVALDDAPALESALEPAFESELVTSEDLALPATPRWTDALPNELPPLSLAAWIGSAAPVIIGDAAPATDVAVELAPAEPDVVVTPVVDLPAVEEIEPPMASIESSTDQEPAVWTAPARRDDGFVDLGDWLRSEEPPRTTRLATADATPTGDEDADFRRMLGVFKAGIARNVDVEDHAVHYDLGVAFREMGLVDEAIAEFQRAARSPEAALRSREALGQCFLDRGSPELAVTMLERALAEAPAQGESKADEISLLGVVYLLGEAHERLGQLAAARACFERVVASDIEFRDAARRLTQLPAQTP